MPVHQLRGRAGGVGINGPDGHVRHHNRRGATGKPQEKGTMKVLLRLQRLILDEPVPPLLSGNRGAPM